MARAKAKKKKKPKPKKATKKAKKPKKPKTRALPQNDKLGYFGTARLHGVVRERVSCGCSALDAIMGGGVPVGRIMEVTGEYATGKTSFYECLAAQVQKGGGEVAIGLTEATIAPDRLARIGVDVDRARFKEFELIPEGFAWLHELLEPRLKAKNRKNILMVAWDTIGGSHPEDTRPGSGAREVREGLRRVTNLVAATRTILVLVNQVACTFDRWAIEPATPFGQGVRYHASIRLSLKGLKRFTESDALTQKGALETRGAYGIMPVGRTLKNKTFPPFRVCRVPIQFDGGFDDDFSLYLYLHEKRKLIELSEPNENEPQDRGKVVRFKMEPPAACCWNDYRTFLAENPKVKIWMQEKCLELARRGYNPIA